MEITCDGLVCRVDGGEFTRRKNDGRPRPILDENDNEK